MNLTRDWALIIGLGVCAVIGILITYTAFYADQSTDRVKFPADTTASAVTHR